MPDKIIRVKKAHFERTAEDIMIAMMDVMDEMGLECLVPWRMYPTDDTSLW